MVLSRALFSLLCTPSHCLILSPKASAIIKKITDDSQLHQSSTPSDFHSLSRNIEHCVDSVGSWMTGNRMKLNNDKTEALVVGSHSKVRVS